jgi:beta-lactamase class D
MYLIMLKTFAFVLGISLTISSSALAQNVQNTATKPKLIFQSEFSRNLAKNFQDAKSDGCFILYDLKRDRYIRYNPNRCQKRFIPASTFKIFNSLVALETKAIADENTVMAWDGVKRQFPIWNEDQTMRTAFPRSVVWFYQDLARKIGKERMTKYIQDANYGNQDISPKLDSFWLNGNLKISPEEQVKFLVKLYQKDLPFSNSVIKTVKDIMIVDRQETYTLSGKTGWSRSPDGTNNLGWYVGYVEKADNTYFYALNFENQDPNFPLGTVRRKILYSALEDLALLE